MEGRIGAPKRRVLCPRRFRDEEDWAMFRSSGTKRKVTFLSTGEGSRRRQKLMDGSIGGRRGKRSIAEDCDEGSVQEEEGAGNPGEEVSRDLDDVTSAGRGREAAESPGDTAKSAHNPAESPIRSVMPQPSPREPTTLPTITNDLGSAALGANPSPLPPPHGNPNNPAPKGAEGDGAANFPRSTRTPRGPGRRAVPGQARGGKAKNKIRPRVQTASTSSSFQYPPSPEHNRTATTRGHWEEEEADDAEWGREPVPTLPRQRSLFPRGGGNSRPGRAGEYSFLRVPNHRGLPRRPWGDNHWERDDSCYVVGGYYDDYVDDYDTVDVFPSSSQKYRQRRPESRMCYVNDGVPSFYFRNREEEDSWFQWRKERELRRQEEEGSSRGPEGEGRASASADGRTTQKKEEVPGRTVAATGELNVPYDLESDSEGSDSEEEGGKILALIKKILKGKGQEKRGEKPKANSQPMVPVGAADTYACALTETADHLPKRMRKNIEAGKFVDIYDLTRESVQAKEDGVKEEEREKKSKTIFDWLKGFLFFSSVYLEKKPEQCLNIIKYIDTIIDTYLFYKGSSWSDYDRAFRKKIVSSKVLSFGQKDIDLWTRWVSKDNVSAGNGNRGPHAFKPRNICFAYNEKRCTRGYACKFKHVCLHCGFSHTVMECNKKKEGQGNRQPFRQAYQKSGNANPDSQAK
ncbi:hypothetical protein XENTR_v10001105 [Xenopus tropicalis]|nr:hypothetical protein XENTR_v10001105 [Xenopus tropicalis]KAE8631201.1 hypothetical protein XENTR_v10001105 [Xenopus tropicalis]